jgi:4-hydroxybenzoate polyprenyltransferase
MATPGLAALLWLDAFPPLKVIILGLITAFAGYTAVYALNDVIDYRADREKLRRGGFGDSDNYLDAVMVRHPVAQGILSLREGILWVSAWAILALFGAYLLNPVCSLIFITGCALETIYCLMWRTSHLRTIVSGAVKTSGGVAAVFAVDPNPSPFFVIMLFLWLFFWEIGGQNIPADWTDVEEDRSVEAKTIPVRFGPEWANAIILSCLVLAIATNVVLVRSASSRFELPYVAAFFLAGFYLLLIPAYRLYKTKKRLHAQALFNRASYYPLALLLVVMVKLTL